MSQNRRQHIRLFLDCSVFIDLAGPPVPGEDPGEIVLCKTLDISYAGLRISLARELPAGALLQIGVEFPAEKEMLHLVGEVKWCRANDSAGTSWSAGLELAEGDGSDIHRWRELMHHV